jgi:hypothetical protein
MEQMAGNPSGVARLINLCNSLHQYQKQLQAVS